MFNIIGYTLLILTFIMFKKLRNLPGYCVTLISASLLLAEVLYVTGIVPFDGSLKVCIPIGALMHLFLLSGQFWAAVIAIDISLNVFSTKPLLQTGIIKKKFRIYCLITTFLACGFAIIEVLFNKYNILDVEFNRNNICALSGFYAHMVLYFIPVAISTFIGISILCVSICMISHENRKNKKTLGKYTRQKNINFAIIALKLTVICGLSEAIGFINIYKSGTLTKSEYVFNSVFGLAYSIMKGFRGVMLCLAYLCNKRVMAYYQECQIKK